MIYLDNASTTLKKPGTVAKAVYDAIASQEYGNASRGAYEVSLNSLRSLYEVRAKVAELFCVENPLQVSFTPGVTISLNYALRATLRKGDHVITGCLEHNSVLRPLYQLEKEGVELSFLPVEENFSYDLDRLESLRQDNTTAVVLTQMSNVTGAVTDLPKLYDFCRRHQLLLILDGAQGGGSMVTDLSQDVPEMLYCFTGHKSLYGPMGTGGIINLSGKELHPVFTGGAGVHSFERENPCVSPDLFEPGTVNIHSLMGLKAGVEDLLERQMKDVERYLRFHRNKFYDGLRNISNLKIYSPKEGGPILAINIGNRPSTEVCQELYDRFQICTRAGAHCAPLLHEQLGTREQGMVRFSLSVFNRIEEIDFTLFALSKIAKE